MAIWKRVRYTGRVQGVGFRYTAQQLASEFGVDGYVHNLPTGDVEVLAGSDAKDVEAFLSALADRMAGYIEQTFEAESRPSGEKGFHIRY
jgi:acylphosphatase